MTYCEICGLETLAPNLYAPLGNLTCAACLVDLAFRDQPWGPTAADRIANSIDSGRHLDSGDRALIADALDALRQKGDYEALNAKATKLARARDGILKRRGSFLVFDSSESAEIYAAYLAAWGGFPSGTPAGDKGYAWGRLKKED